MFHSGHVLYANTRSHMRVNGQCREELSVGVGTDQGSVLSPLLFILVLEVLPPFTWETCLHTWCL